jgi:hypothetical protein
MAALRPNQDSTRFRVLMSFGLGSLSKRLSLQGKRESSQPIAHLGGIPPCIPALRPAQGKLFAGVTDTSSAQVWP